MGAGSRSQGPEAVQHCRELGAATGQAKYVLVIHIDLDVIMTELHTLPVDFGLAKLQPDNGMMLSCVGTPLCMLFARSFRPDPLGDAV
jgi:hypothetical protein